MKHLLNRPTYQIIGLQKGCGAKSLGGMGQNIYIKILNTPNLRGAKSHACGTIKMPMVGQKAHGRFAPFSQLFGGIFFLNSDFSGQVI